MALGGWLAGLLYDHFGYYAPAFAAGIGSNILNLLVVGMLVLRHDGLGAARRRPNRAAARSAARRR